MFFLKNLIIGVLEAGHQLTFRNPLLTSTREERTVTCNVENNHFDLAMELLIVKPMNTKRKQSKHGSLK